MIKCKQKNNTPNSSNCLVDNMIIISISCCITNPGYEDNKNTHYAGNKPENSLIIQKLNIEPVELEINTKIYFEIDNQYNYRTTITNQTGETKTFSLVNTFQINDSKATTIETTYNVTEIEKIDEKDVYVIAKNNTQNPELKILYYFDKET